MANAPDMNSGFFTAAGVGLMFAGLSLLAVGGIGGAFVGATTQAIAADIALGAGAAGAGYAIMKTPEWAAAGPAA